VRHAVEHEVTPLGVRQESLHATDAETALNESAITAATCSGLEMREPTDVFSDLT
jgi:hypothetical protein